MRVLTFNTWHGLSGSGLLSFGELEPVKRRLLRFQLQERELSDLDPDLLFLQELNPAWSRAASLAQQMGMNEVHQTDQSGVKLVGFGIPTNLNTGLAILAKQGLALKHLRSLKLSGPGFAGDTFSMQAVELRYAIFAEISHSEWGSVLLCNAHLHHGMELAPSLARRLRDAVEAGVLTSEEREKMEIVMEASRQRRLSEMARLFEALEPLAKGRSGVLLAGDLNSTPDGSAYQSILSRGFVDLHARSTKQAVGSRSESEPQPTWDPPRNRENHEFSKNFTYTVPVFGRSSVKELLRDYDLEPRRIDFLFARGVPLESFKSCGLWGDQPRNGIFLSDHFGVLAQF